MAIESLPDIGANAGPRADELIGQDPLPLGSLDFFAHFDNF